MITRLRFVGGTTASPLNAALDLNGIANCTFSDFSVEVSTVAQNASSKEITDSAKTLTLVSTATFPSTGSFLVRIDDTGNGGVAGRVRPGHRQQRWRRPVHRHPRTGEHLRPSLRRRSQGHPRRTNASGAHQSRLAMYAR